MEFYSGAKIEHIYFHSAPPFFLFMPKRSIKAQTEQRDDTPKRDVKVSSPLGVSLSFGLICMFIFRFILSPFIFDGSIPSLKKIGTPSFDLQKSRPPVS